MQLLSKALNLSNEELKERTFFFKTCGMDRWRPLLDLFIHVRNASIKGRRSNLITANLYGRAQNIRFFCLCREILL